MVTLFFDSKKNFNTFDYLKILNDIHSKFNDPDFIPKHTNYLESFTLRPGNAYDAAIILSANIYYHCPQLNKLFDGEGDILHISNLVISLFISNNDKASIGLTCTKNLNIRRYNSIFKWLNDYLQKYVDKELIYHLVMSSNDNDIKMYDKILYSLKKMNIPVIAKS